MANGHGGKRPGSGRPRKDVQDWQSRNLLILRAAFSEDDVRQIADCLKRDLRAGDKDARKTALAYVFGAAPKEVTLIGDPEQPVGVKQVGSDPDGIAAILAVLAEAGVIPPGPSEDGDAESTQGGTCRHGTDVR